MNSELPSSTWSEFTRTLDRDPVRSKTFQALNLPALESVASEKRNNTPCAINKSQYAYGGDNLILEVVFEDKTIWIARLRLHEPKFLEASGDVDKVTESEVATMRFLKRETNIPVPSVSWYDARYKNEVGQPYILMEAMPGKRLWGGPLTRYIPAEYEEKVYQQFADIMLQLYSHPFPEIGMLYPGERDGEERIGEIVDQHTRFPNYGPFFDSSTFYQTRCRLVDQYYSSDKFPSTESMTSNPVEEAKYKKTAIPYIVDSAYQRGPFYLAHPDFQITNCLFDDEFNVTALLDWTGCQTLPFESFAFPPWKVIQFPDEFLEHYFGTEVCQMITPDRRKQYVESRRLFLKVLEEREHLHNSTETNGDKPLHRDVVEKSTPISATIRSPRSYFAHLLNWEGIVGFQTTLPKDQFDDWKQCQIFSPNAVREAYSRIQSVLNKTPVLTSSSFNSLVTPQMSIYFKAELFQKCGVFKFRGASNAIARLPETALKKGVVTHSSGNHSAALACAARERGIKCYVVMPANASKLKIEATRAYGAEITFVENPADRAKVCDEVAAKTGATLIPPYDFEDIILGQGTVMYEFQNQMKEDYKVKLDAAIIPVGGGGLLGGCGVACIGSGIRVFAAEPAIADDCARGFAAGSKARLESTPTTIADGLRTEVGELNFGIIKKRVERVFTVTEEQIALAMRIVIERLKVVIEPSAAVAVAVVLFNEDFKTLAQKDGIKNVGIVLEGGNIDTGSYEKMMPWIHLTESRNQNTI